MIRKYEISPGVYWKKSDFFKERACNAVQTVLYYTSK